MRVIPSDNNFQDHMYARAHYDFYFEWFKKPIMEQINTLIKKIDKTLKPLGCSYTITTKS